MDIQLWLNEISSFLPRLLTAIVLIIVAFIVAAIVRAILRRAFTAARLDQRMGVQPGRAGTTSPSNLISELVFWVVVLLFLPAILSVLGIQGLLAPVQNMVNQVLTFLPNLLAAALILIIGIFVARLVRQIVTGLLSAAGVDRLGARVGFTNVTGQQSLATIIGWIVYVLILIPVITAAINALGLGSIMTPLTNMLNSVFEALPRVFAAALLLILAYVIARLISTLVSSLLTGIGFDAILTRIGLGRAAAPGARTPSNVVGYLVFVGIMLFASIEAARLLGFTELASLIAGFTVLLGQIIMGLIIFGLGLFLANLAYQAIRDSGVSQSYWLAWAARIAILVLAGAMALRQMGLAPEIINLAFGLLLGAVAVAVALAFGLGGQQVAGRILADTVQTVRADRGTTVPLAVPPSPPPTTPTPPR